MRRFQKLAVPLLMLWAGTAGAADLTKVDRTLRKEPAYQSKPKYCLLVFGPKAEHRVWLVLDGDTLYVDKNGNGDLTDAGERFTAPAFEPSTHPAHERERTIEVGDLTVDGLTHAKLSINQTQYRRKPDAAHGLGANTAEEWQGYLDSIWKQIPGGLVYMVTLNLDVGCYGLFPEAKGKQVLHFAWVDKNGQLVFADRPQDTPVVHFGGPLTLRVSPSDMLHKGDKPPDITLCLGTEGLGAGAFATMCYDLVPMDLKPAVEVRYPPKEPNGSRVTRKEVIQGRC